MSAQKAGSPAGSTVSAAARTNSKNGITQGSEHARCVMVIRGAIVAKTKRQAVWHRAHAPAAASVASGIALKKMSEGVRAEQLPRAL